MSGFTIFIIIVMVVSGFLGWRSGLLRQVGRLVGIIAGIAACRFYGPTLVDYFCGTGASVGDTVLYTVLSYVLLFIVVYVVAILLARLVRGMLEAVHIGILNRVAGAVFNIMEWMLLLSLFLNLWMSVSPSTALASDPVFDRVLWFGPFLLGTDAVATVGKAVTTAIGA